MSTENQLSYAHILNRLQNGAILRIGPFAELNFETFSNVIYFFDFKISTFKQKFYFRFQMTNKIYSTLMFLVRLMKWV